MEQTLHLQKHHLLVPTNLNIFNDSLTKRKIHRHLLDINDTITEEDIRNVQVSIPEHTPVTNKLPKR